MIFVSALSFLVLHAVPTSVLRRWLCQKLTRGPYRFEPQFSGRVSLFLLARRLLLGARSNVALVPDYVCNIVPRAFRLAGWQVVSYPTGEDLEPDWDNLLVLIAKNRAGALVGASVFGSSGLLSFLEEPEKLAILRTMSIHVVIDMAQDIRLVDMLPVSAADFAHGVVSFNDKSFLGAMGGGILTAGPAGNERTTRLSTLQVLYFYRSLLAKLYRSAFSCTVPASATAFTVKPRLEYSLCDAYPYEIENSCYIPAKIQFVMALLGLRAVLHHGRRKMQLLQQDIHLATRFSSTAAYVVVAPNRLANVAAVASRRARKHPYALEQAPDQGLRSDDVILHNKGFLDRLGGRVRIFI